MGRVAGLALVLMFVAGTVALSAEEKPVRTISVSGTVATKIAPDQIVWSITLVDTDKNLLAAKKRNDERVKSVLALRKKLDVAEGDAETGSVWVQREYERDARGDQGNFKDFRVARHVTIRQRDLKRFDEFFECLVASTDMEVQFRLESSRVLEVRAQTRLKALQAAKDKAAAMAGVLGAKLGRVLTVSEYLPGDGYRDYNHTGNAEFGVGTGRLPVDVATGTFVPGSVTEEVTVHVVFELE